MISPGNATSSVGVCTPRPLLLQDTGDALDGYANMAAVGNPAFDDAGGAYENDVADFGGFGGFGGDSGDSGDDDSYEPVCNALLATVQDADDDYEMPTDDNIRRASLDAFEI